jgi:hypothetical protein
MDFTCIKRFGSKGTTNGHLHFPSGITYYDNFIYVCDLNNRRIQKFNENLIFQETLPLDFEPWNIQIANNVACIRPNEYAFTAFYQLNPFSFKIKVYDRNDEIYSINSWFYMYRKLKKNICCYDINGNCVFKRVLTIEDDLLDDRTQSYSIGYFNKKLMIGASKTKKLIIF